MTIAWSVKPACVIRHLLKDKNDLVSQPQIKSLPKMIFLGGFTTSPLPKKCAARVR